MIRKKRGWLFLFAVCSFITVQGQLWKAYRDSAAAAEKQRQYPAAAGFLERSVEQLRQDSAGALSTGLMYSNLGSIYIQMAQYPKAETALLSALGILEKLDRPKDMADVWDDIGMTRRNTGRYPDAETAFREALDLREKALGNTHSLYARSCSNIGILYQITGRYSESETLLLKARAILSPGNAEPSRDYASNAGNLAILYSSTGQYDKALQYMTEGNRLWERLTSANSNEYAVSCNNLGRLYLTLAAFDKAEEMYLRARKIRATLTSTSSMPYALVTNNLGVLYLQTGQYPRAESFLLEARGIFEKNRSDLNYALNAESLGNLRFVLGKDDEALFYFREAVAAYRKILSDSHPLYFSSTVGVGNVLSNRGQYDSALLLLQEAEKNCREKTGVGGPSHANICNNISVVYRRARDFASARYWADKALQAGLIEKGDRHPDQTYFLQNLALIHWYSGQADSALLVSRRLFELRKFLVKDMFRFSTEKEKYLFLESVNNEKEVFFTFCMENRLAASGPDAYDRVLFHRNLILHSQQQLNEVIRQSPDPGLKTLYADWQSSRQQLAYQILQPGAFLPGAKGELDERLQHLEKELTKRSASIAGQLVNEVASWRSVQQQLKQGEAALEFFEYTHFPGETRLMKDSSYFFAVLVHPGLETPVLLPMFEKRSLEALLKRKTGNQRMTINRLYASDELYKLVWQPLEKQLRGIHTIYFATSGLLQLLSLPSLPAGAGRLLGEQYRFVQVFSTAHIADREKNKLEAGDKLVLYGNVQYDADSAAMSRAASLYRKDWLVTRSLPEELMSSFEFPAFRPLPETGKEIDFIAAAARSRNNQVTVYQGPAANEESFKYLDEKKEADILHIATHAFFYPDPGKSRNLPPESGGFVFKTADNPLFRGGLVLAGAENTWKGKPVAGVEDGILTAYEISNLSLPGTKLVVLSACQTARGDLYGAEGVYGLQRAFKLAGAGHLLMSLWDVDDAAGAEFMQAFYSAVFNGSNFQDAFREAQRQMRKKYPNQPFLWAGFILVR